MKVIFLNTTNELFKDLINKEVELDISMQAHFTFNPEGCSFDFRKGHARTSTIRQINYTETSMNCYEIRIDTHNSTYWFQYGKPSDRKALTKEEKLLTAMALCLF